MRIKQVITLCVMAIILGGCACGSRVILNAEQKTAITQSPLIEVVMDSDPNGLSAELVTLTNSILEKIGYLTCQQGGSSRLIVGYHTERYSVTKGDEQYSANLLDALLDGLSGGPKRATRDETGTNIRTTISWQVLDPDLADHIASESATRLVKARSYSSQLSTTDSVIFKRQNAYSVRSLEWTIVKKKIKEDLSMNLMELIHAAYGEQEVMACFLDDSLPSAVYNGAAYYIWKYDASFKPPYPMDDLLRVLTNGFGFRRAVSAHLLGMAGDRRAIEPLIAALDDRYETDAGWRVVQELSGKALRRITGRKLWGSFEWSQWWQSQQGN